MHAIAHAGAALVDYGCRTCMFAQRPRERLCFLCLSLSTPTSPLTRLGLPWAARASAVSQGPSESSPRFAPPPATGSAPGHLVLYAPQRVPRYMSWVPNLRAAVAAVCGSTSAPVLGRTRLLLPPPAAAAPVSG